MADINIIGTLHVHVVSHPSIDKATNGEVLHDFGALNTLLFVIILGMCIVCAYLIKEYKFYYLPESGAAMIVGLIVGAWYECRRCTWSSHTSI